MKLKFPKVKSMAQQIRESRLPTRGTHRVIKRNKYGAIKQAYKGGMYMSKKEAREAMVLDQELKQGKIKSWKRQEKIRLDANGDHICNYYIDFTIEHNDGIIEYREVKGYETDTWRLKWKLFCSIYGHNPNYKLTIVK